MRTLNNSGELKLALTYEDAPYLRGLFEARMQLDSTTQVSLQRYKGSNIYVSGSFVDVGSGGFALTTSNNLLSSTGTDSGGAMGTNTLYYVYVSNSSASFAPSSLRASTTAPSLLNGVKYLATSGNGANWRFVGWVRTNGSTNFLDSVTDRLVINYYNRRPLPIELVPGYVNDNTGQTWTASATSWTKWNAGTGSDGSYIANGEDAVDFTLKELSTNGASGQVYFGIGDNSTSAILPEVGNFTALTSDESSGRRTWVPAEGYRTVHLMYFRANANATIYVDNVRGTADADPYLSWLSGVVRG